MTLSDRYRPEHRRDCGCDLHRRMREGVLTPNETRELFPIEPLDLGDVARLFNVPVWMLEDQTPPYSGIPPYYYAFDFEVGPNS